MSEPYSNAPPITKSSIPLWQLKPISSITLTLPLSELFPKKAHETKSIPSHSMPKTYSENSTQTSPGKWIPASSSSRVRDGCDAKIVDVKWQKSL